MSSEIAWDHARLSRPAFASVADLVARLADEPDWPSVARLDELLAPELRDSGVRLIEARKIKPARLADGTIDPSSLYEVRIVETGEVPTRPRNLHDLLNAVIWAAFPRSKLALSRALARLQRERATGRTSLPPARTREHDRLALVDEGALLCVRTARSTATWIFGHAVLEHAYFAERDVRGTAVDLDVPGIDELPHVQARAAIDRCFAAADLARVVRAGPGIPVPIDHSVYRDQAGR